MEKIQIFSKKNLNSKSEYGFEYQDPKQSSYKNKFILPALHHQYFLPKDIYEHSINKVIPRKIESDSTYYTAFGYPTEDKDCKDTVKQSCEIPFINPSRLINEIDPNNFGHEKYLDIYATTNALNHRLIKDDDKWKNDAITVWDWFKIPKVRGKSNID